MYVYLKLDKTQSFFEKETCRKQTTGLFTKKQTPWKCS